VDDPDSQGMAPRRGWSRRRRLALGAGAGIALALGLVWVARVRLADHFVAGELTSLGLPARYRIDSIGPGTQVFSQIVIGDPAHPDMTIERVIAQTGVRGGVPGIRAVTLVRPMVHGRLVGGRLSLGSLDKLFTGPSSGPFRLPDLAVTLIDGEARIAAPSGAIGVALSGSGALRDGFAGTLGAVWLRPQAGGCQAGKAVFAGSITVANEQPGLAGPLRLDSIACAGGIAAGPTRLTLDGRATRDLAGGSARLALVSSAARLGIQTARGVDGDADVTLRGGRVTARYRLALSGIAGPQASARQLAVEGTLHGDASGRALATDGAITGADLVPGPVVVRALADARQAGRGTLVEPLLGRVSRGLARAGPGNRLAARFTLRRHDRGFAINLPDAVLSAADGTPVVRLSRLDIDADGAGTPRVAGNFALGGPDLPTIQGRMEPLAGRRDVLRLAMADYAAGSARLVIPELVIAQAPGGALGFVGRAELSGALPGGGASRLRVPISGDWSARRGLALWRGCARIGFDRLVLANLSLENRDVTLCPQAGSAIVEAGRGGTRVAAGAASLDLAGHLGQTPIMLASGPVGFAVPGKLAARDVAVTLGTGEGTSRFRIANLAARIGRDVSGTFANSDIALAAVPLDLHEAGGNWRYAGGVVTIDQAQFRLVDREKEPRFNPLLAHDGTLRLADNHITASATLRAPKNDRAVARVAIRHDLGSGQGHADLAVDEVRFDKDLQPDTLTPLALGVVANVMGVVRGGGVIDWTPDKVTSSGRFSTDALDLAAAFGPATGVSGTIEFTDLLGMVTAPGQTLKVASINPGIEVDDGVLHYALLPGHVLAVDGARWPFLDGTLELMPTRMTLGLSEVRRYELKVSGINAAKFLARLEISNLSATGTFDGSVPLVFDQNGGRIEGGVLAARAPGGNVSYVGDLTYKDLSPMANFAFATLRSLNYRQMRIGLDGSLAGEVLTRLSMGGVTQGPGTKSNFLTRQVAKLPIRFDVNIRAPFFQLVSSFKSFYDPTYLRDPRSLGLIDAQGHALPVAPQTAPPTTPQAAPQAPVVSAPGHIQPPDSESKP
jgi:hypothetical protein